MHRESEREREMKNSCQLRCAFFIFMRYSPSSFWAAAFRFIYDAPMNPWTAPWRFMGRVLLSNVCGTAAAAAAAVSEAWIARTADMTPRLQSNLVAFEVKA